MIHKIGDKIQITLKDKISFKIAKEIKTKMFEGKKMADIQNQDVTLSEQYEMFESHLRAILDTDLIESISILKGEITEKILESYEDVEENLSEKEFVELYSICMTHLNGGEIKKKEADSEITSSST